MRMIDIVRRSGRSLRSAKTRTFLTAIAIAIGGFTLTATLAAGNGIRSYTDRLVASNFDPTELLVGRDAEIENTGTPKSEPKEYNDSVGSLTIGGNGSSIQVKQVTDLDVGALKQLPYVDQVRENYQITTQYITRDGQKKYTLSAVPYNPSQKPEIVSGDLPAIEDLPVGYIALPEGYVSVLGFSDAQDAIGKEVQISVAASLDLETLQATLLSLQQGGNIGNLQQKTKLYSYKVGVVTKKAATNIGVGSLPIQLSSNDSRELYDYSTKGTSNYGKYVYVSVKVKGGADAGTLKSAQDDLKDKGYYTQSSKDIQKSITQIVDILQILVGVFGLITVIASVFGIVNTQYISVLERTREIGLMKALGMRSRDVRTLFMLEAGWIGFLGGIIGSTVAFIVGLLINPWITEKLSFGEGNKLLIFDPVQIAALVIALTLVAILAGWLPARKASKLDPIEALRTE
jgi:putative ABC transport system permease protein